MAPRPRRPIRSSSACARPSPALIPGLPAGIIDPARAQLHRTADGGHRDERNVAKAIVRRGAAGGQEQSCGPPQGQRSRLAKEESSPAFGALNWGRSRAMTHSGCRPGSCAAGRGCTSRSGPREPPTLRWPGGAVLMESGADPPGDRSARRSPRRCPALAGSRIRLQMTRSPGPSRRRDGARADSCFQRLVVVALLRRLERHGLGDRFRATAAENLGDVKRHL